MNNLVKRAFDQYAGIALSLLSRYPVGTNVYEREWDTLILLDTCRIDAIKEVADEYEFLPPREEISAITSRGSISYTWMANTFVEEYSQEVANTVYISANAFSEKILENGWKPEDGRGFSHCNWDTLTADDLLVLDQPWQRDEDLFGHPDPKYVTKRAIGHYREYEPERMIVHYSMPHEPYIANAVEEGRSEGELYEHEKDPWRFLKNDGSLDVVWESYITDLRMVLDNVADLLNNHSAEKVVISADHGEAFGGLGVYGHPIAVPHPKTRRVPWAKTTAKDTHEIDGSVESNGRTKHVEESLKNLGYL